MKTKKTKAFDKKNKRKQYFTKVSDLVSNGLNDRSNRMQSSMLELLR